MRDSRLGNAIWVVAVWGCLANLHAQYGLPGSKLFGSGSISTAQQGYSVAISADGNTAIAGGPYDNPAVAQGAAWVFTRNNGSWTQQAKLAPAGLYFPGNAGWSVAISGDGNTAILGAPNDNQQQFSGAAFVFMRSNGVWTQLQKLVGTVTAGGANQGAGVALSGDGKTAVVGGPGDNGGIGAVWVFTLKNGKFAEQQKLTVRGETGASRAGYTVAISSDGSTIITGAPNDAPQGQNAAAGAAWVFALTNGVWAQQGNKLAGTGASLTLQGLAVALSGNGNTAAVGGPSGGGAWVFTRSGSTWTQQAGPLGNPGSVQSGDGQGVALTGDGNTLIVGGPGDNDGWVFTRTGNTWNLGEELVASPAPDPTSGLPPNWLGYAAAISNDGSTVMLGAPRDSTQASYGLGAAWVYTMAAGAVNATGGTPQAAPVGMPFAANLSATVYSAPNVPATGVTVTFTAPSSGPSGTFPGSSTTATAITDSTGTATAPLFTANNIAGSYAVTAAVSGIVTVASFNLTNAANTTVNVTLQTSPANLLVSFDGGAFAAAPVTMTLMVGSSHMIATQSPQALGDGTQDVFANWSDGLALAHGITVPASDTTYTATFNNVGPPPSGQYAQQGSKVAGSDGNGFPAQGFATAVSADGNTAVIGGPGDGFDGTNPVYPGAAWVWIRSNGSWSEQQKLTASDGVSTQQFGKAVAISADGNTLIVGGPGHFNYGAAWIFTRSNGVWTQRQKLLTAGPGVSIDDGLGWAVALSGDGRTALVGSPLAGFGGGSAWVFARNADDSWTQQSELYGSNVRGETPQQGYAVGLSDDGNTAIVGVPGVSPSSGALIFRRASDGRWTQQGGFLNDPGMPVNLQGQAVAISGDGQTALVATPNNQSMPGVAGVYSLVNGTWTQQARLTGPVTATPEYVTNYAALSRDGNVAVLGGGGDVYAGVFVRKAGTWSASGQLTTGDVSGGTGFGISLAISSDASTIVVGGPGDAGGAGAAWIFGAVASGSH